jgi:RNA polymerase sigma-54 factor
MPATGPHFSQQAVQVQRQEQTLSPMQLQSLQYLMAGVQQLEQRLAQAAANNPALELQRPAAEESSGDLLALAPKDDSGGDDSFGESKESDRDLVDLMQENSWDAKGGGDQGGDPDEMNERRQRLFDSVTSTETLQDALIEQLHGTLELDDQTRLVAEEIIGNIDSRGYLCATPEEIASACAAEPGEVEELTEMIRQEFDPPGVGARDLRDCLLLQIRRHAKPHPLAAALVRDHLDDLSRNQIPKLAKKLKVNEEQVISAQTFIRSLRPHPGEVYDQVRPSDIIVPDLSIGKDAEGQWQVVLNRRSTPRLSLAGQYLEMLADPTLDSETKAYIREKVLAAKVIINAVEQRQTMIERLAWSLLKFQKGFFEDGVKSLLPLRMRDIAKDLSVHEATISRAVANKYALTPWGVRALRDFFLSGISSASGMVASEVVKQRIRDLIKAESPVKPLSDQKISEMLEKEGYKIARRTVMKYREAMQILSTPQRRQHR